MRTGRVRTLGLGLALLVGATAPVLASPVTACAAATSGEQHAGLLIDTGARTTTYCVVLDDASVSGTHLIELASTQFGLDYRLGFGGRAICMLDGVGALGDDCFGAYPNFWGYFHGDGGHGWTWSSGSAADHAIGDGDLEGWTWGTGDSASTHGSPPGMTIEDVCGVTQTSASPEVVRATAAAPPVAGGPPAGGVLALGAIALLGAGGWLKLRRRKGVP